MPPLFLSGGPFSATFMSFSLLKWINLANTTTLNTSTRTRTIHCRHVLLREKSGFLILWFGQQTSRQVYSERLEFFDNSMKNISHPGMSLQVWQDIAWTRPNQTSSGKLHSDSVPWAQAPCGQPTCATDSSK